MGTCALDVAAAIIERQNPIDPMKLQKLLYLAAGHYLVLTGESMFTEPIEAWVHGPVVHAVYKTYEAEGLAIAAPQGGDSSSLSEIMSGCVDSALEHWGGMTGWGLRDLTHENGPWRVFFKPEQRRTPIPNEAIRAWFDLTLRTNSVQARYDGSMAKSTIPRRDWTVRFTPAMRDVIKVLATRAKPAPEWVPRKF
jgi:uncharacterized phage-associated protein